MIKNLELYLRRRIKWVEMQLDIIWRHGGKGAEYLSASLDTLKSILNDEVDPFIMSGDNLSYIIEE